MKRYGIVAMFMLLLAGKLAYGAEELVTSAHTASGESIPYILTTTDKPVSFVVILMPGGDGRLEPRMDGTTIRFQSSGNFLIRSREIFAEDGFAAISTDATDNAARMQAIIDDAQARFHDAAIYIIGTSRSTDDTIRLAQTLDGKVAGFVHTSSMDAIASFDPRRLKSRHLLVYHEDDVCHVTHPASAQYAHDHYGIPLIVMSGGISIGDPCQAHAYHGYAGIEWETVKRIKAWIRDDNGPPEPVGEIVRP